MSEKHFRIKNAMVPGVPGLLSELFDGDVDNKWTPSTPNPIIVQNTACTDDIRVRKITEIHLPGKWDEVLVQATDGNTWSLYKKFKWDESDNGTIKLEEPYSVFLVTYMFTGLEFLKEIYYTEL